MNKWQEEQMQKINSLACVEIPALLNQGCDEKVYNQKRAELNAYIIQLLVGAEMVDGTNGAEVKFNKPLPDKALVATIAKLMADFISKIEEPYFTTISGADDEDDMSIPTVTMDANIQYQKVKNQDLKSLMIGGVSGPALYQIRITPVDVITIAAMGEDARRHYEFIRNVIIAGIVGAVVIGGIAVAVAVSRKRDQELYGDPGEDDYDDYDDEDDEVVEMDGPVVEMDSDEKED